MKFNLFHKGRSSLKEQHDKYTAGASTFSKSIYRFPEQYPQFIKSAEGCTLTDINNVKYTDYVSSLGAISLGYKNKHVDEAVINQINKGNLFSLISDVESECAEILCNKTHMEKCLFVKTGTDATNSAIKLAKAYTGRRMILICDGHYHGWGDWFSVSQSISNGTPGCLYDDFHKFKYNNFKRIPTNGKATHETIDSIPTIIDIYKNQIAAVILEPITYEYPDKNYLKELEEIVHNNGSLLITDEIVTYPRFSNDTFSFKNGCSPDLICIGKGIGNGYSISSVVGNEDIMKQRQNEEVFISGTFFGESIGMVASMKTLEIASHKNLSEHIWKMGSLLQEKFNKLAEEKNVPISLYGLAPRMIFKYPDNSIKSLFLQETANRGLVFGNITYCNMSHTQKIIENTIDICDEVLDNLTLAIENNKVEESIIGRSCRDLNLRR